MLAFIFETFFDMDLYQALNSLAPNFYGPMAEGMGDQSIDGYVSDFPPSDEPVYILGRKYSSLHELTDIRSDIRTLIWITYRRNFPSIGDSGMTADSGWGCMLRTGQMVLAQALCRLHLGRDWRWTYTDSVTIQSMIDDDSKQVEYDNYMKYRQILKMFADLKTAPYSIHQIALMGACEGKNVGEWFGPNTVAQVLKKLSLYDKFNDIHIHVAMDNMVFLDDIKKFCKSKIKLDYLRLSSVASEASDLDQCDDFWRPLVLFIPLRLGLVDINPVYFRALKSTFAFPQSLGILGGRPNHALYFIGCCGNDLIHLDPHTTQTAINIADDLKEFISTTINSTIEDGELNKQENCNEQANMVIGLDDISYHCERASRMAITQLDPSIALCFLCRTEDDFDKWTNMIRNKLILEEQQPLFEIMKERPSNWPLLDEEYELTYPSTPNNNTNFSKVKITKANSNRKVFDSTNVDSTSFTSLESDEDYEIIDM